MWSFWYFFIFLVYEPSPSINFLLFENDHRSECVQATHGLRSERSTKINKINMNSRAWCTHNILWSCSIDTIIINIETSFDEREHNIFLEWWTIKFLKYSPEWKFQVFSFSMREIGLELDDLLTHCVVALFFIHIDDDSNNNSREWTQNIFTRNINKLSDDRRHTKKKTSVARQRIRAESGERKCHQLVRSNKLRTQNNPTAFLRHVDGIWLKHHGMMLLELGTLFFLQTVCAVFSVLWHVFDHHSHKFKKSKRIPTRIMFPFKLDKLFWLVHIVHSGWCMMFSLKFEQDTPIEFLYSVEFSNSKRVSLWNEMKLLTQSWSHGGAVDGYNLIEVNWSQRLTAAFVTR